MSTMKQSLGLAMAWFTLALVTGCESTDGGSSSASVGAYYGVGFYDPWYYGDYDYDHDHDIVVTPPDMVTFSSSPRLIGNGLSAMMCRNRSPAASASCWLVSGMITTNSSPP